MNSDEEIKQMTKDIQDTVWDVLNWEFDHKSPEVFKVTINNGLNVIRFYAENANGIKSKIKLKLTSDQLKELKEKLLKK